MGRLRSHSDFVAVLRRRRKVSGSDVVLHVLMGARSQGANGALGDATERPVAGRRLGLAVSKAVGGAVTRNRIKRRFRVLANQHEDKLPEICDVVLRAKPTAATATFHSLDAQIASLFSAAGRIAEDSPHRNANGMSMRTPRMDAAAERDAKPRQQQLHSAGEL